MNFLDLLVLLFIGLKLTGHIDWSWWWVFAPWWMYLLILLLGSPSDKDEKPTPKKRTRR